MRPPVSATPRSKEAFGFAATDRLYLCQQNVRKYHPHFDRVLADILRGDSQGIIGIIADEHQTITDMLMARLRAAMPDVADRLRVIGRLEREPYLELVAAADVVLDTPHYGGGANTVLDAVAAGAPVVTWPSPYHRGRWAAAVNRQLGLDELNVANLADYAATAIRVASNVEQRRLIYDQITSRGTDLFENAAVVNEWQEWLLSAANNARL